MRPLFVTVMSFALLATACAPAAPSPTAAPAKPAVTAVPAKPAASPVAKPTDAPPAKPKTLARAVQAVPVQSFGYLPLYVGVDKGFFADEGLGLEIPVMASNTAVAGLVSGEVDFASAGTGIRAAMQGLPIKAVMYYYNTVFFEFVVAPEINRLEDLKGKAIGIDSPGSTMEQSSNVLIKQVGLDPSRDVVMVNVGAGQQLPALLAGSVQGIMLNPDLSATAADNGFRILKTVEEVGRLMPQPFSGFGVSNEALQKKPDVIKAWMRANIKALQFVRQNTQESAAIVSRVLKVDQKIADTAVPKAAQAINPNDLGGFSDEGIRLEIEQNLQALRGQATTTRPEDLTDLTLLRQVQREMGVPCRTGYKC